MFFILFFPVATLGHDVSTPKKSLMCTHRRLRHLASPHRVSVSLTSRPLSRRRRTSASRIAPAPSRIPASCIVILSCVLLLRENSFLDR